MTLRPNQPIPLIGIEPVWAWSIAKPKAVSCKLDPDKQAAFIKAYENLLNQLGDDEAVLIGDAVHPTHAVRPVGCWAPKDTPIAVEQTSGRQRLNIHGASDLETGRTRMIEAATVNAISMIMLLRAIEAMYPGKRLIHLFVDNARYHHAKLVQAWLARPGCRVKLHFIPAGYPAYRDAVAADNHRELALDQAPATRLGALIADRAGAQWRRED
jgi:hypothetical protein